MQEGFSKQHLCLWEPIRQKMTFRCQYGERSHQQLLLQLHNGRQAVQGQQTLSNQGGQVRLLCTTYQNSLTMAPVEVPRTLLMQHAHHAVGVGWNCVKQATAIMHHQT